MILNKRRRTRRALLNDVPLRHRKNIGFWKAEGWEYCDFCDGPHRLGLTLEQLLEYIRTLDDRK